MYKEIEGDLIVLAKEGMFDVIAHGCNCWNRQKSGVAKQMVEAFGTDKFKLERPISCGDINKLGQIDWQAKRVNDKNLYVVNCYTQFKIAKFNDTDYEYTTTDIPFDYQAFALCCQKMNHIFKGEHIGMPMIGTHLAQGDWNIIKAWIRGTMKDVDVTIVKYKP